MVAFPFPLPSSFAVTMPSSLTVTISSSLDSHTTSWLAPVGKTVAKRCSVVPSSNVNSFLFKEMLSG